MKYIFYIFFTFCTSICFSQAILVDNTTQTPTELVNLLIGNACIEVSNITISTPESVGYFDGNSSTFPLSEGIIIRSGNAKFSEGIYTGNNLDSQANTNTDAALQALVAAQNQTGIITDVAFLEFDFVSLSNNFSFDFLFASNEYGQYQCASFDTFAFLLTDLNTNVTTNIAVIPGTSTPVNVLSIRNSANNAGCSSSNAQLFSTYNVTNPAFSSVNMRGFTTIMNASATILPNNPYKIRLVIGDYIDYKFDSAIFLKSGSFTTTIDLGEDSTICTGNTNTITTGLIDTTYIHVWTLNGVVLAETSNTLTITQPGTYTVTVTTANSNCVITDEIVFTELSLNLPNDLYECYTLTGVHNYNLTLNNETSLGINDTEYDIFYYASLTDLASNTPIADPQLLNYSSLGNETIYIKIFNTVSNEFCDAVYSFDLLVEDELVLITPPILNQCAVSNPTTFNLSSHFLLSNPLDSSYTSSYFESLLDAESFINAIANPAAYILPNGNTTGTVWVRVSKTNTPNCFAIVSFDLNINPLPLVDILPDPIIVCTEFELPQITNGNYFSGLDGTGTPYFAGDILSQTGTYYIFNGPDENGCTNQSSFYLFIIEDYSIQLEHCGQFIVPEPPVGSFYTAAGGPTGSGTLIPTGTVITSNQSIFYYAEHEGTICRDEEFPIVIHPLPPVEQLNDVVTCVSYTLTALSTGNNYMAPYTAGSIITQTSEITIVSGPDLNGCANSSTFTVFIIPNIVDVVSCGSYFLPELEVGNYYLLPGGDTNLNNTLIPELTEIATLGTTNLYVYADTTTLPNCTNNFSFQITIHPQPIVDENADVEACDSYILPPLTNGTYYRLSGGPSTPNQVSYAAGQIVDLSGLYAAPGTFYIYVPQNSFGCDNETSFNVVLNPLPNVIEVSDYVACQPYTLANPPAGNYYTEPNGPNGSGTLVSDATVFTETKLFYLYSQNPTTLCFIDKPFTVFYYAIELPDFDNISECDTYTLPSLTHQPSLPINYDINYYNQPGGNAANIINPSNYTFSTPGTYTVYVHAKNGERFFNCIEEKSFTITISETPVLPSFANVEICESYTLPNLTANFNINYYSEPNGVGLISPTNYTIDIPGIYDIYVYADSPTNSNCNDEEHFTLTIYPLLTLVVDDKIICVDNRTGNPIGTITLESGLNPSLYLVNWYFNNQLVFTGPNYTTNQSGIYTIETFKLTPIIGDDCNYEITTAEVLESSSAIATLYQSSDFDDIANITVEVINGLGIYEFSLDNGPYQASNVFYNVSSGDHIVTIRDIYGNCEPIILETTILKYPHFFSPNGDGANETWNIFDMQDFPNAVISIFDRYGKLLIQIKPNTPGWDGKYNGQDVFASDYWFVVNYTREGQEKVFRGHFSLIR